MRKKKIIFICQVTESCLKVITCFVRRDGRREFQDVVVEHLPAGMDDAGFARALGMVFRRLKFKGDPVIISLPRKYTVIRHIQIPAVLPEEIEKIISLQAGRFSPYPVQELVSGYQVISADAGKGSSVNVVVVHKNVLSRFLTAFTELKVKEFSIVPSSWGLCSVYFSDRPPDQHTAMVIDIDFPYAEVIIGREDKVLFSRSFACASDDPDGQRSFADEVAKTLDAYAKEVEHEKPLEVLVTAPEKDLKRFTEYLNTRASMTAKGLKLGEHIQASKSFSEKFSTLDTSLASLVGMGLGEIPASLNLLPQEVKDTVKRVAFRREVSRLVWFVCATLLVAGIAGLKGIAAKQQYVSSLRAEAARLEREARPLEIMERKIDFLKRSRQAKSSSLEILYQLHRIIPEGVSLENFIYEESDQVILRGQSPELDSVFTFVSGLENSSALGGFAVKLKYVTKKAAASGERIDFEIDCVRNK